MSKLESIIYAIKKFFKKLLKFGNETTRDTVSNEIKEYYDYGDFNTDDVRDIAMYTEKEDELFTYADVPDYYRTRSNYNYNKKEKDDYDMCL